MPNGLLFEFQKELYEDAYNEAAYHLRHQPKALQKYQKTFTDSLPNSIKPSDFKKFLTCIKPGMTLLIGDFHPSGASQKAARNLIDAISQYRPDLDLQIGIEFFKAEHEALLHSFMNDRITESELLKASKYQANWGFPWKNYGRLLKEIKQKKLPIFPFNFSRDKSRTMKSRDKRIARHCWESKSKLEKINGKVRTQLILVGEHHLAPDHLPRELIEVGYNPNDLIRLFCNLDHFYFDIQAISASRPIELAQLSENSYCIFNSAPWIKWKSMTIWHESQEKDFELRDFDDSYFDIDYLFLSLTEKLCRFMRLNVPKNNLENFNLLKTNNFDELSENKIYGKHIPEGILDELYETVRKKGYAYIPETRCLVIDGENPNHLIELSGQHLFNCLKKDLGDHGFLTKTIRTSFGFLARKIYDPNFSLHLMDEHRAFLAANSAPTRSKLVRRKRISAKSTLKFCEILSQNRKNLPRSIIIADKVTAGSVSRSIGKIIGNALFETFKKEHAIPKEIMTNLTKDRLEDDSFDLRTLRTFINLDANSSGHDAA